MATAAPADGPATPRIDLGTGLLALWRLSRPEAWTVSLLPFVVGHVLATREALPGLAVWTTFWNEATQHGADAARFTEAVASWWPHAWPFLLGCLVTGPLAWTATLLWNDVHDLDGDRRNPRKARSPLVQGVVSRGWAHRAAWTAAAAALLAALPVGLPFTLLVATMLLLAWLYSAPPLRLKVRPGADVLVNAVGVGGLAALAGWSAAAPLAGFPWPLLLQGLLVATAVYVPTTLVDHEADYAAGYTTLATHLGPRRAYQVGWWAWMACNAGALLLSLSDTVIPRAMLPILLLFCPLLLYQYHAFIGKARNGPARVQGIILCSLTFLCVNAVFVLMYTGMWVV